MVVVDTAGVGSYQGWGREGNFARRSQSYLIESEQLIFLIHFYMNPYVGKMHSSKNIHVCLKISLLLQFSNNYYFPVTR